MVANNAPDSLKIAAVQYPLGEGLNEDQFFAKMTRYLDEAQAGGAEFVVFPELVTMELLKWVEDYQAKMIHIGREFFPRFAQWTKEQAKSRNVAILAGTSPRYENGETYNTAVLAFPDGRVILQDKIFLTPDEKSWGWTPGRTLQVFKTLWGRTVIATCFDCEFPTISNLLADKKPDLILVPSWTSSMAGYNRVDWTARARSIEHYAYVVKTGTVGDPSSQEPHYGQASVYGPQETGFSTDSVQGRMNRSMVVFANLDLLAQRERKPLSGVYPANEQTIRETPLEVIEVD